MKWDIPNPKHMLYLTVPVVVIFLITNGIGMKTCDVPEVDGMYALARWRLYHLLIIGDIAPVEPLRCKFDGIPSGVVVKFTCRAP
jgi:hypothetical protein